MLVFSLKTRFNIAQSFMEYSREVVCRLLNIPADNREKKKPRQ